MERPIIWYEPIIKREMIHPKNGTLPHFKKTIVYKVHMRGEDKEPTQNPPCEPLE